MGKKERTSMLLRKRKITIIMSLLLIMVLLITGVVVGIALRTAASAAKSAFSDSLKLKKGETYQAFYQTSFDIAEEKYHVENKVTISVEDIKEIAGLEVLQVSDIEYVYNEGNTKIWTAVKGHGVYTVDLSLGEFLVDEARQYVRVRVPSPQLGRSGLDYEYENYLFEDGIFNGSTKKGVDLAQNDLKAAQNQLQVKLTSTQIYYESAQKCAEEIIRSLVRNCNPGVTNLVVDVEFID